MRSRPLARPSLVLVCLSLGSASCATGGPGLAEPEAASSQADSTTLTQVSSFGSNPGNLLMFSYAPSSAAHDAPLVVALHGCTQAATDYEAAGWNALADKYGFYLVYPQQQSANNIEECFNWYGNTSGSTADITRGQGEAESVIQMIQTMESTYSIDPKRVFVNGFSAGAAYAVALLAMYPDVFAAGSSFSGLPYGCATSLTTAYSCMDGPTSNTPAQWGDLARAGYPGYSGPYPRISVWQGSSDTVVNTANLSQIVSQWTNVTGVSSTPTSTDTVAGFPHQVFADSKGVVQVESFSITGMPHAVSLDVSAGCGTASTYFVDEKLCAVEYSAAFFGIGPTIATMGPDGGKTVGSSSGTGSGSGSGSGGGTGSSSSGSGGGSGTGSSSGTSPSGDEADAGPAQPASLPGCAVAPRGRAGGDGWLALACAAAVASLARRRSRATADGRITENAGSREEES